MCVCVCVCVFLLDQVQDIFLIYKTRWIVNFFEPISF